MDFVNFATGFLGGGDNPFTYHETERSPFEEAKANLQLGKELAPDLLKLYSLYRPLYGDLEAAAMQQALLGSPGGARQLQRQIIVDAGGQPVSAEAQRLFATFDPNKRAKEMAERGWSERTVSEEFETPGSKGLLALLEGDVQPVLDRLSARAARSQREADIADVLALGPKATEAYRAANPEQARLLQALMGQATSDVEAGYNLPSNLRTQVRENVAAGQARRGFGFGPADAFEEALMTTDASTRWRDANLGRATQIAALNQSAAVDPFMALLGRPAASFGQGQGVLSQGGQSAAPSRSAYDLFNPFNSYAGDIYDFNANATNARRAQGAQAAVDITSAIISAIGGAAKGGMMCWVAREVYGASDARWLRFREWLLNDAPGWFRELYRCCGPRWAHWVRRWPWLKRRVRAWMDRRLAERERKVE